MNIPGTTGGTVSPERVTTDASGKAKAKFKMGSEKNAIINAHLLHDKPIGCPYAKLGSTSIGSVPIKVEISYFENESQTLRRAAFPGTEVKGGDEVETTNAAHTAILYHYPSATALKKGFLIFADPQKPQPGAKTEYIVDYGYYSYDKKVNDAEITVKLGNVDMVKEKEEGSSNSYDGYSSPNYKSSVMLSKGTANQPAGFSWGIQYSAKQDGEEFPVYIGMPISKGEEGVEWIEKQITDPNSPYKTEYIINVRLDAAEELKKGNKAMKALMGMDSNDMIKMMSPTSKGDIATATGSRSITVRILSPYSTN